MYRRLAILLVIPCFLVGCNRAAPVTAPPEPAPVVVAPTPLPDPVLSAPPPPPPVPIYGYVIEAGPDRNGPWSPLPPGQMLPADSRWIRLRFPSAMASDPRAEWPDPQTALLQLEPGAHVIDVGGFRDAYGTIAFDARRYVFGGDPPVVQRITPAGARRDVAFVDGMPERLDYARASERVRFQAPPLAYWVDLATGAKADAGGIMSGGHDYGEIWFAVPGGKRSAQLFLPEPRQSGPQRGTLVITEGTTERLRLPDWLPVDRSVPGACMYGDPTGAFRPDGQALVIAALPTIGTAELWHLDLTTKETRVLSRLEGQARAPKVTWSPDGSYITFGPQVLDAATGAHLPVSVGPLLFWSLDGRRLLTGAPQYGKWGALALITPASGQRVALGHGWPLGFTRAGDAVILAWETSRELPPDPCR